LCLALVFTAASGVVRSISSLFFAEEGSVYSVRLKHAPRFGNNNEVGVKALDELIREHASRTVDIFPDHNDEDPLGRWIAIYDDDEDLGDKLRAIEGIERVEEHGTIGLIEPVEFTEAGDDRTWNLEKIHAAEAHKILGEPKRIIVVAVVDTGIDPDHPAIKDRLLSGRNIVDGNNNPRNKLPSEMHSTHVSGTIIMDPQHSGGAYGVAYPAAKVLPVRVLNEYGSGSFNDIARGIVWAADNGARVINLSLGGTRDHQMLHDAIHYAAFKNVIIVAAKGNSNTSRPSYPADYEEVLAVTATDRNDERAFFSNYGDNSCCAAPGYQIFSSVPGGRFMVASGTSMASPHVSASVALILAQKPDLNRKQVQEIIEKKGDEIKTDKPTGRRINCMNFLTDE
ncbi:MAG: S8 family serine peptidase, partial [Candidatus Colwellbacteria bacterium]|nr:S8 family serine peptidase [Candidatus Colwellbacteria bacterium]